MTVGVTLLVTDLLLIIHATDLVTLLVTLLVTDVLSTPLLTHLKSNNVCCSTSKQYNCHYFKRLEGEGGGEREEERRRRREGGEERGLPKKSPITIILRCAKERTKPAQTQESLTHVMCKYRYSDCFQSHVRLDWILLENEYERKIGSKDAATVAATHEYLV